MHAVKMFFIKRIYFELCLIIYVICIGCAQNIQKNITVVPEHFKIRIPYEVDKVGIILSTFWGSDKIKHKLYFDNNSPTWANDRVIQNNRSVLKAKNLSYKSTAADGTFIKGEVYTCDSISIGQVTLKNFDLYKISNEPYAGKYAMGEGALGENLLSEGVWKIDFKNKMITFASSIDSIGEMQNAQLLPCKFNDKAIEIEVTFLHRTTKIFQLDLGFNGAMIIPLDEFKSIENGNKAVDTESLRFSTPSSFEDVENMTVLDSIKINRNYYLESLSANKLVKERLIGRLFFEHFEFLILDYLNKSVYISKNAFY
jgi:hypothetical protein